MALEMNFYKQKYFYEVSDKIIKNFLICIDTSILEMLVNDDSRSIVIEDQILLINREFEIYNRMLLQKR